MSPGPIYAIGRRDKSEPEVIAALKAGGATVIQLSGRDCPDLAVGVYGRTYLVECKSGKASLRPGQRRLADGWAGGPIRVLRSASEAARALREWEVAEAWDGGGPDAAAEDSERAEADFLRRVKGDEPA